MSKKEVKRVHKPVIMKLHYHPQTTCNILAGIVAGLRKDPEVPKQQVMMFEDLLAITGWAAKRMNLMEPPKGMKAEEECGTPEQ